MILHSKTCTGDFTAAQMRYCDQMVKKEYGKEINKLSIILIDFFHSFTGHMDFKEMKINFQLVSF